MTEPNTVFELASTYAIGITKNHASVDGNKRTALVASVLFLEENGHKFGADPATAEKGIFQVADGAIYEARLAQWFEENCRAPVAYVRPPNPPELDPE